ncbi:hypothetical protein TNCV_733532 [Trichonephila clavipes]|nr:hypothetical protein TNCV_733532 [Trichonephila clavipes]
MDLISNVCTRAVIGVQKINHRGQLKSLFSDGNQFYNSGDNSADKRRIGYGFTRSIEKDQNSVLFIIYIQTLGMMKGNSTVILE